MSQTERPENVISSGIAPGEGVVQNPYVQQFEERLTALNPLYDNRDISRRFGMDRVGLYPDKFTAAILLHLDDGYEILLGQKAVSGYFQMDHSNITTEYGIEDIYPSEKVKPAFIMTAGDKRFMIASSLRPWREDLDKLKSTLIRYGISITFSASPRGKDLHVLADDMDLSVVSAGDYQGIIDGIIFDGWTSQVAERFGLTNIELLRLRLQGELPKDKQKPLPMINEDSDNEFFSAR